MGSVTYRMLCQTTAPVLALPPSPVAEAAAIKKSWRECVAV
jgi:hypothetical protein